MQTHDAFAWLSSKHLF